MKKLVFSAVFLISTAPVLADTVVAVRTIRAHAIVSPTDVAMHADDNANAISSLADVIGQEAQTTIYAGRPILYEDVGPPALVTRNQIVLIEYQSSGLRIVTEARALQRGAVGDRIRIMNLDSKATIFGQIQENGTIRISK